MSPTLPPNLHLPPAPMVKEHDAFVIRGGGDAPIEVTGIGGWSPIEVDRHFDELADLIAQQRQAGLPVRVLVDLRGATPQSEATLAKIGMRTRATYRAGDRVAIMVTSSIAKMQMRQVVRSAENQFFISPHAARLWLTAFDHGTVGNA